MLRPRQKITFQIQEILDAKVMLYGAASPVHTKETLRKMFTDAKLNSLLETQKKSDVKTENNYPDEYEKQKTQGLIAQRIDQKMDEI